MSRASVVTDPSATFVAVLFAVLFALAFHVPLVVSDSVLWDDVTIVHAVETGQSEMLVEQFSDAGAPHWGAMHAALGRLPGAKYWYKAIALACLLGATGCVAWLLSRDPRLSPAEAMLIAVMAAACPLYSQWQGLIMLPYAICYLFFFAGAACYRRHFDKGRWISLWAVAALGLLAVSFTIESFGVFFYGVLGWFFLGGQGAWSEKFRLALRQAPALLLPAAVYFGKRWLFPMRDAYANYNRIEWSVGSLAEGVEDFLKRSLLDPPEALARFAAAELLFFAALAAGGLAIAVACLAVAGLPPLRTRRDDGRLFLTAAALFWCGALPYIAVGKAPSIDRFESRHALLLGLPLALAAYSAASAIFRRPAYVRAALAILLAGCFVLQTRSYVRWQTRYVKWRAIAENLKTRENDLESVVVIDDRANFGMPERWRTYEINAMLRAASGSEERIGCERARFPADIAEAIENPEQRRYWGGAKAPLQDLNLAERGDPNHLTSLEVLATTETSDAVIYWEYLTADDRAKYSAKLVDLRECSPPSPRDIR
jgi:hypothetical protein